MARNPASNLSVPCTARSGAVDFCPGPADQDRDAGQITEKTHEYRQNIHKRLQEARATKQAREEELAQLAVLEEYAAMVEAALNVESLAPFDYGGLAMQEASTHIQTSLERLGKKGRQSTKRARSDSSGSRKL